MLGQFFFERFFRAAATRELRFLARRCLRARFHACDCEACVQVCPRQVLSCQEDAGLRFDRNRCVGCMLCAGVCPGDAFDDGWDPVVAFERASRMKGDLVFSCHRVPSVNSVFVPCLGSLSYELLAALFTLEDRRILLDASRCKSCDNSYVPGILEGRLLAVAAKMGEPGCDRLRLALRREDLTPPVQKKVADPSRRSFLQGITAVLPAEDIFPSLTEKKTEEEQAASVKRPARNRETLRLAMEGSPAAAARLAPFVFRLEATDSCNFCRACVGMCPTGALRMPAGEDDGETATRRLTFTAVLCSGCGLCVAFCRRRALILAEGATADPLTATVLLEEKKEGPSNDAP